MSLEMLKHVRTGVVVVVETDTWTCTSPLAEHERAAPLHEYHLDEVFDADTPWDDYQTLRHEKNEPRKLSPTEIAEGRGDWMRQVRKEEGDR